VVENLKAICKSSKPFFYAMDIQALALKSLIKFKSISQEYVLKNSYLQTTHVNIAHVIGI
jgi:hypothetical protein